MRLLSRAARGVGIAALSLTTLTACAEKAVLGHTPSKVEVREDTNGELVFNGNTGTFPSGDFDTLKKAVQDWQKTVLEEDCGCDAISLNEYPISTRGESYLAGTSPLVGTYANVSPERAGLESIVCYPSVEGSVSTCEAVLLQAQDHLTRRDFSAHSIGSYCRKVTACTWDPVTSP